MKALLILLAACTPVNEPTFEADAHIWERSRIPLSVTSTDNLDARDIRAAVNVWNTRGCTLLRYDGAGDHGDIVVRVGDDISEDAAGGWQMRLKAGKWYGDALIRQPFDRRVIFVTAAHELGHVLGLAHDLTQSMSIMYPHAAGRESGYVNATDKDLKALAARYCE